VVERLDKRFTTSVPQKLAREGTSAEFEAADVPLPRPPGPLDWRSRRPGKRNLAAALVADDVRVVGTEHRHTPATGAPNPLDQRTR
jgi:hypothetical protein